MTIFKGKPLAIHPSFVELIEALVAEPRLNSYGTVSTPRGARIASVELIGFMEPDVCDPITSKLLKYAEDPNINGVIFYISSPGGLVTSTPELAEAVRRVKMRKPIHVVAAGYLASAAYWVACQATSITCSPSCLVGSIGCLMVVVDSSELFRNSGLKVILIGSSELKGMGTDGTKITDEHTAALRRMVDFTMAQFEVAVSRGRGFTEDQLKAVTTAEVWVAQRAQNLGLIDDTAIYQDAIIKILQSMPIEAHAELEGQAAEEKFLELANVGIDEDHDDFACRVTLVSDATVAKLEQKYPLLTAEALKSAYRRS